MGRRNSRKKGGRATECLENSSKKGGGDTECGENMQEQHDQLMESFRSLLSVEVSFLFPTMAGIQHVNKLDELSQAVLLVTFLLMGCIGTVAFILSHSPNAMRWSSVVSRMTLFVSAFWLGIFHIAIGLLIPESYMEANILVNTVVFIFTVLLVGSQWKIFFRPPKCGENTPNEDSSKKGDAKQIEKLQDQHNKLMTSFRSLLSTEVSFMFPSMVGITHLDKFGERGHAFLHMSFLVIGYIGTIALIVSHSTDAMKWSAIVFLDSGRDCTLASNIQLLSCAPISRSLPERMCSNLYLSGHWWWYIHCMPMGRDFSSTQVISEAIKGRLTCAMDIPVEV